LLIFRSIAVDDLECRFGADENVQILHLYFDYKSQQTQTALNIGLKLLTQLLSCLDDIPEELEALYSRGTKPDLAACKRLLTSLAQKGPNVFAVFDAIDECHDTHQKEVLALFGHLQQSGYRLLISSRPHLLQNLRDQLEDTEVMDIYADESDLKNYIKTRLREKGNKDQHLEYKCLDLASTVQGM
jgi:hypothetical protein